MRFTSVLPLLALLPGAAFAISARQASNMYDEVCPSKDGQEKKLSGNTYVEYHCNTAGEGIRTALSLKSPRECALACNESSGCKVSMWVGQETRNGKYCMHYPSASKSESKNRVVTMTYRVRHDNRGTDDLFPDDNEDDKCQKYRDQIDDLEEDLLKCEAKLDGDDYDNDTDMEKCPFNDHSRVNDSGNSYKVYCSKLDDVSWQRIKRLNTTPRKCITECSNTSGCTRAIWRSYLDMDQKGDCWLRSYDGVDKVPTTDSNSWSSAHLQ